MKAGAIPVAGNPAVLCLGATCPLRRGQAQPRAPEATSGSPKACTAALSLWPGQPHTGHGVDVGLVRL